MIEVGGKPIIWHIMKEYSHYGFNDFIICAGYKQHIVKEWFNNYFIYTSDVTYDMTNGKKIILHEQHSEPWRVTVVDTGLLITGMEHSLGFALIVHQEAGYGAVLDQMGRKSLFGQLCQLCQFLGNFVVGGFQHLGQAEECLIGQGLSPCADQTLLQFLAGGLQGIVPVTAGIGDQTGVTQK